MSLHTLGQSILNISSEEFAHYFTNILLVYTQNNPHKICLDKDGLILEKYKSIACDNEFIRFWIKLVTNEKLPSIEYIQLKDYNSSNDVFLEVCIKSYDKVLVVGSKQEYASDAKFIADNKITLVDKDDVVDILSMSKRIIKIEAHDGSLVSLGNNSPNKREI